MPTEKQIVSMVAGTGFRLTPEPGFVSFRRKHPDGRRQLLRVFWWSNKKVAAKKAIPNAYLVVCLGLDQDEREESRHRLPLVDWPSTTQAVRPWSDVAGEFTTVFMDALNAPSADGHRKLNQLGDRYILTPPPCHVATRSRETAAMELK
ncbi:MAG: hypothetical protein J2P17_23475 [Mycobacterium sp.]|nr:hypothetical protein [Mycobacterium sp.]